MKVSAKICSHCRREDCDGIIYKIADKHLKGWNDEYYKNWRGCKNNHWIDYKDNKPYFHWVMGHGIEEYYDLEEIQQKETK